MTHGSDLRDFHFKKLYFGKPRDSFSKWTLQWMKDKNYIPSNLNQLLPQRLYCYLSNKNKQEKKKSKNTYQARIIFQVTIFPSFGEHMWIYLWKNLYIPSNNKTIKTVIELEKDKFGELTLSEFSTYWNCSNQGNTEGQTFRSVE